jgi:hypothetical protein
MLRELEVWEMEEVVGGCPEWLRQFRSACEFVSLVGTVVFSGEAARSTYNYMASNACSIAAAHGSFCGGAAGGGGSDTGSGGASKLF